MSVSDIFISTFRLLGINLSLYKGIKNYIHTYINLDHSLFLPLPNSLQAPDRLNLVQALTQTIRTYLLLSSPILSSPILPSPLLSSPISPILSSSPPPRSLSRGKEKVFLHRPELRRIPRTRAAVGPTRTEDPTGGREAKK